MTRSDIHIYSGYDSWTDFISNTAQAEIWTEDGHRIDGACRGDRPDYGITVLRPEFIPRTKRHRVLKWLYIQVDATDRETITGICAHYGSYPDIICNTYIGEDLPV